MECEHVRNEEESGKGLKSEPVQPVTGIYCLCTCAHTHIQRHTHAWLVLPAYYQPRKGVFPLPEEIRVAPETNGEKKKISFPFA